MYDYQADRTPALWIAGTAEIAVRASVEIQADPAQLSLASATAVSVAWAPPTSTVAFNWIGTSRVWRTFGFVSEVPFVLRGDMRYGREYAYIAEPAPMAISGAAVMVAALDLRNQILREDSDWLNLFGDKS